MKLTEDNAMKYWGNSQPICPHCDYEVDIYEWELFDLYEEGEHEIECPGCEKNFRVESVVKYTFNTDEQPDADDIDPSPYCQYCGAMSKASCQCGPIADND